LATQPAERVAAGQDEAADHVAGDVHVDQLVPQVGVFEQRLDRVHVDHSAAAEPKPSEVVHPGVDRDHHQRAGEPGDHDRNPR
jgi:hypothetical protein